MAPFELRKAGLKQKAEDAATLDALIERDFQSQHDSPVDFNEKTQIVPVTTNLLTRDGDYDGGNTRIATRSVEGGQGSVDPDHINNAGMLALFAVLGAAFVITAIWFFFWAKDGGFVWTEHDWEDYKSTVLRRKDADGRTLSSATPSTNLGGGSIVRGEGYYYDEDDDSRWHRPTDTELSTASRMKGRLIAARDKIFRRRNNDDDSDVKAYRREKPARIGGINTDSEAEYSRVDYDYESTLDPRGQRHGQTISQVNSQSYDSELTGYTNHHLGNHNALYRSPSGYSFVPGDDALSNIPEDHSVRRTRPSRTRLHHDSIQYSQVTEDYSHEPRPSRASQRRRERNNTRPQSQARRSQSETRSRHGRSQSRGVRSQSRHGKSRRRYDEHSETSYGYTEPLDLSSVGGSSEYNYSHMRRDSDFDSGGKSYHHHHPVPGLTKGYRRGRKASRSRRRDSLSESENELVY